MSSRRRTDLDSLAFLDVFKGSKNRCKNDTQQVAKIALKQNVFTLVKELTGNLVFLCPPCYFVKLHPITT